jgi:phosphoserine phosphatase
MKNIKFYLSIILLIIIGSSCTQSGTNHGSADNITLSLWNEGKAKTSILTYIETITNRNSPYFLSEGDRIAVFDMDGTILLEKPNYVLMDFIIRRMLQQIEGNPSLKEMQPYKAVYENDWAYFDKRDWYGDDGLYSILLYAHDGFTNQEYMAAVEDYFKTVKDKRYDKPYNELVYAPVVQLIKYLQAHQFEVYIVSGSDPQITRTFCEAATKILKQNVLGTTILTDWVETDTSSFFVRKHGFVHPINDVQGKPINILNKIGKIPVIAVGNSTGDYHMLEYSKNAPYSLQLLVNHDDPEREYEYHKDELSALCKEKNWIEISMKNDFNVIFE